MEEIAEDAPLAVAELAARIRAAGPALRRLRATHIRANAGDELHLGHLAHLRDVELVFRGPTPALRGVLPRWNTRINGCGWAGPLHYIGPELPSADEPVHSWTVHGQPRAADLARCVVELHVHAGGAGRLSDLCRCTHTLECRGMRTVTLGGALPRLITLVAEGAAGPDTLIWVPPARHALVAGFAAARWDSPAAWTPWDLAVLQLDHCPLDASVYVPTVHEAIIVSDGAI